MKLKLILFICIISALFTACNSQAPERNPEIAPTVSPGPSVTEVPDKEATIHTEKKLFDVEITFPSSLMEGSSQEEIKLAAKENDIHEVKFNDDGSVTYIMDKSAHKKILDSYKASIDESITDILNNKETYPSFTDIKYNEDLTEFTVLCDKGKYSELDSISAMIFYVSGNLYQVVNGVDSDSAKTIVNFIDSTTGEVLHTANSSEDE